MLNLPAQPTHMLGREGDIAAARKLLLQPAVRLLTFLGHGGVGKTRLATALAESVSAAFPDGVCFVDLVPLTHPDQVVAQTASALGLHETSDGGILARLKTALRDRATLLVLDNFEHVIPAAPLLLELLQNCPQVKILVTSRIPLHIRWEYQFPVTPLALPDLEHLPTLTKLSQYAAVRLFVERAQMVQPDFRLTEENAATVSVICHALDGLPLAIELAAARVKTLSLVAMRDWLCHASTRRPLQLLTAPVCSDLPPRQLSLSAAIDWSYRLLTEEEQTLFRHVSVFAGDFSLNAAELLFEYGEGDARSAEGQQRTAIFELIASLVDKSLLVRRPDGDGGAERESRYQMLQTIRQFAQEQLVLAGELREAQRRHAFLFTTLAEGAEREQYGPNETIWFNRLARDWDNLRAALSWCLNTDAETGLRLAGSLGRFWEAHDEHGEGLQWLEAMLARVERTRPETLAKALSAAGTMAWRHADFVKAMEWHRQSLDLYRSCGDQHGCALALNHLGVQYQNLGDLQAATAHFEECIALSQQSDDLLAAVFGLTNLGLLHLELHELPRARDVLEEALTFARTLGSERVLASVLNNLGEVLLGVGDLQAAGDLQRECVQRCYDSDLKVQLAFSLEGLAGVYRLRGMFQKAARLFGSADSLRAALNVPGNPGYRQSYYDPTLEAIRNALGDKAFETAWAAGRATPLADAVVQALADWSSDPAASASPAPQPVASSLSQREREVARLIARGLSNRQIADTLVITEGTAANHVAHIMNKLDCRSRAHIAAWAVACGLVTLPEPT